MQYYDENNVVEKQELIQNKPIEEDKNHFEEEAKAEPIHKLCKDNDYSNDVITANTFDGQKYRNNKIDNMICDVLKTAQNISNVPIDNSSITSSLDSQLNNAPRMTETVFSVSKAKTDNINNKKLDECIEKINQLQSVAQTQKSIGFCEVVSSFIFLTIGLIGGVMMKWH